jgi:hypothetical protein
MTCARVLEGGARCASPAEPGTGADALQRPLRSRFQARLSGSVSRQSQVARLRISAQIDVE